MTEEKKILLLGNGYVAGPCLDYLLRRPENTITVASRRAEKSLALTKGRPQTVAIGLDVDDQKALEAQCNTSLIPYTHHAKVIKAAVKHKKHVVTTSYVSPAMQAYDQEAKAAGITVMNEIGVDPGIDHLYAIKTIKEVHEIGGKIISFLSYCGGLPAPEASNNPLGYKFSWSSRGVLLALRNTAKYLQDGKPLEIPGPKLMDSAKPIYVYPAFAFEGYANRDSTPYSARYSIPEAQTILRGTLRYQGFPKFIKALVDLGFLNDEPIDYLSTQSIVEWKDLMAHILKVDCSDESALIEATLKNIKVTGEDADKIIHGLKWLGLFSKSPVVNRGNLLDTLCGTLEGKMMYLPGERDMVMLQHKFIVELKNGQRQVRTCTGLWYGTPNGYTAMASTVGIPCGIATQLILDDVITKRGVLAPMTWDLVEPLIEALEKEGIKMDEEIL